MSSSLAPALGTLQRSDGPKPLFLFGCVLCNGRYQKLAAEPKPVTVVLPFPSDHKQPRERGFHNEASQKDAVKRSRLANHSSFLRCSPA